MKAHACLSQRAIKSLLALVATAILCSQPAVGQVARPDPTGIAVIEGANESLSPVNAFENLEIKAGRWQVENGAIVQGDRGAPFARAFVTGPCWMDCIITATRSKFTEALDKYYANEFSALKKVVDQLQCGRPVTEKLLLHLGAQRVEKNPPGVEPTGLNIASDGQPVMIEIEATCNRFDVARVDWSTSHGDTLGQSMEFIVGYPGVGRATYRVTFDPGDKSINTLRLEFPTGAAVDLKQIRVHRIGSFRSR